MDIVPPPVADGLRNLLKGVSSELSVVSPWIKNEGVNEIASVVRRGDVRCRVLMRGDLADFVSGASDIGAVRRLLEAGAWVGQGRDLHAKVYLADRACALVGSANLTGPGMRGNAELGVIVDDEPTVATLHGLLDEWFARAREVDAKWLALMERAAGECTAARRQAAAAEDVVRRRGRALGGPRIWSGRGERGGVAPVAPFPEGLWSEQLAAWLERKKIGALVPDAIRFFGLAFANLPEEAYEWAYWGALKTRVSLTIGNLWVATLAQGPRRLDLLATGDVDVQGGDYDEVPSTSDYTPVGWIVVPGWEGVKALNDRPDVWISYREACIRLLDAPVSRTIIPKNNAGKTPVADLLAQG